MKIRQCYLGFALMLVSAGTIAQSAGDYRSNVFITGNWSTPGSWQRFNGATWVTAVAAPSSSDGVITILNAQQIIMNTATNIDQVVIASGGQLLLFDLFTPFTSTLANGPGTDIDVFGTLTISLNATLSGAGSIVNNSSGSFVVNNQGTLAVTSTNNGVMQITGIGNISNTIVTNNLTVNFDNTLNLNNASFINKGVFTFDGIFDSNITGTGGGIFTNDYGGTLFKTGIAGTGWIDQVAGAVSFSNKGLIKGYSSFAFRTASVNTGEVDPGDSNGASLGINPSFITGKSPTFELQIASSGGVAGVNYDQVSISNLDAATVNVSGTTLNLIDNASDLVGTVYTIVTSTSTVTGTFAVVHLSPSLGNLTYNANSITVKKIASQTRYTWFGGNGGWTTSTNWSPFRTSPAATDILIFNSGNTVNVTNVPTQTVSAISVTSNTNVNLQSATTSKTLTIGNGYMNYLNIDPGSSVHVQNNAGIVLNPAIASGSRVTVGGVLDMQNGTFSIGDNVMQLHTTSVPLTRTSGQFAIGTGGSIEFGDVLHVSGPVIALTNSIFVAPPSIASVTVYRLNGASFGNQSITVNQAVMALGDLTTNAAGRIILSPTATNPVESSQSKIIGYADLALRTVGTAAINFLGVSSPAGSTIGSASLTRVTGPSGINTFNGFTSIASTWTMAVSTEPTPARSLTLSWLSDFDNGANTTLKMQDYRFDGGPGWTSVGSLALLQAATNPRSTTAVTTLKLSGSWTIGDQNSPLPIVMGDFHGRQITSKIALDWTTLSEVNSDYFEIQRRTESEERYTAIGVVKAQGTSALKRDYSFEDEHPVEGNNYYRLNLVDLDDHFDYSRTIVVANDGPQELVIYPDPNNGADFAILVPEQSGMICIYDLNERKVASYATSESVQLIPVKEARLPAGVYIVIYESKTKRIVSRMIVM